MAAHWSQDLHQLLRRQNIRQVSFVPDAGHAALIKLCEADSDLRAVRLTTEEEGIALAVGDWLGGAQIVLLLTSTSPASSMLWALVADAKAVRRSCARSPIFQAQSVIPDRRRALPHPGSARDFATTMLIVSHATQLVARRSSRPRTTS